MRTSHFEHFEPFCPVCVGVHGRSQLALHVQSTAEGHIIDGWLTCGNPHCLCEFPILDGVPILVPDPAAYIASQYQSLTRRTDLPAATNSMLIECQGAGQWDDAIRQHISGSAWDHWAEFDPAESGSEQPGAIANITKLAVREANVGQLSRAIDVGCALGRSTFELARHSSGLVLGVEIHAGMILRAAEILRTGHVGYDRRRCGMLYDRREFAVPIDDCASRVDFWIMNASRPCIEDQSVDLVNMLNVIDCTPGPLDLLKATCALVRKGGHIMIATPFDWSPAATATEAWIGGHSPRGYFNGVSEEVLRGLLTEGAHPAFVSGFDVVADNRNVPWQVRLHERSIMKYSLQLIVAKRRS